MPKNKCSFQNKWLSDERFSKWIKKKDEETAECKYCQKEFNISNMGESALTSHIKGKPFSLHYTYFICSFKNQDDSSEKEPQTKSQAVLDTLLTSSSTVQAEIRWILNIVCSKYSMNSSRDSGLLFASMFPDSNIAKSFQCGRTKASYVAHFGLAPFFYEQLLAIITNTPYYTILFDESLNESVQQGQMDILVRFWSDEESKVVVRYLGSEFMGRSTANDVLITFLNGTKDVEKSKMLQVSSDGPNVNLLFLKHLTKLREEEELPPLLDIGTCGLHVVHGSLKTGAKSSEWDLQRLLKAMWQLLHGSPARRAVYENVTESMEYPSKFCGHRWCENEGCAEKAEVILKNYQKFITRICSLKMKDQPDLKTMIHDPLMPAKLKFFEMISGKLNGFLRAFQTDNPMIPFMADILGDIVRDFFSRIVLKGVMDKANTIYKLIQLDLGNKDIRKRPEDVDIGFAAKLKLQQSGISPGDTKVRLFKQQASDFLAKLLLHLLEKSPLKQAVVRSAMSLNPVHMANKAERNSCISLFSVLLQKFVSANRIKPATAELAKVQYEKFMGVVDGNQTAFLNFDFTKDRLDVFFSEMLGTNKSYQDVWNIFKMVFVLSHGQASIEDSV